MAASPDRYDDLYTYVGNDPTDRADPTGMEPGDCIGQWCPGPMGMWSSYDEEQGTIKGAKALPGELAMTVARAAPVTGTILAAKDFYGQPSLLNGISLAVSLAPGGGAAKLEWSIEKAALYDMAKADFRRGITQADFEAYKDLNSTLSDPFHADQFHGPESHAGAAQPSSRQLHYHVAGVNHIPAKASAAPRAGSDGSVQVKTCIAGVSSTSHDPCGR